MPYIAVAIRVVTPASNLHTVRSLLPLTAVIQRDVIVNTFAKGALQFHVIHLCLYDMVSARLDLPLTDRVSAT